MEYHVKALKKDLVAIREQLEALGKEGWELISIVHQPDATKDLDKSVFSGHIAYLKKT